MKSQKKRDRLDELDAMLRTDGVHVETVAERWGVRPTSIMHYLSHLRYENGKIVGRWSPEGTSQRRLLHYSDVPQSQPDHNNEG